MPRPAGAAPARADRYPTHLAGVGSRHSVCVATTAEIEPPTIDRGQEYLIVLSGAILHT